MGGNNFFSELRRRNVTKVAIGYGVLGWLLIEIGATIVPLLQLPDSLSTAVTVVVLSGFPVALIIAWVFEMTPEGMKRTENVSRTEKIPYWSRRKFGAFVVIAALLGLGLFVFQRTITNTNKLAKPGSASGQLTK